MSDPQTDQPRSKGLLVPIIVIGAFVLALGGAGWFGYRMHAEQQKKDAAAQAKAQFEQYQKNQAAADQNKLLAQAALAFCKVTLNNAKADGIVPRYTVLTSGPKSAGKTGRYSCGAATDSSNFTLTADFVCKDLTNSDCISLYQVAQKGGGTLYTRSN